MSITVLCCLVVLCTIVIVIYLNILTNVVMKHTVKVNIPTPVTKVELVTNEKMATLLHADKILQNTYDRLESERWWARQYGCKDSVCEKIRSQMRECVEERKIIAAKLSELSQDLS